MLTSEALPVIGVPPVPIGAMRSKGVSARAPSPFDGIPPATLKTAPSLIAFDMGINKVNKVVLNNLVKSIYITKFAIRELQIIYTND